MDFDLAAAVAATAPASWTRTLAYRSRANLPMDSAAVPRGAVLLLDTTVYIDQAKRDGLPLPIATLLATNQVRHSRLCISELAFGYGYLSPHHPASARNRAQVQAILDRITETAIVDLSAVGWAEAGALAGILARIQGLARDQRRELLLDAALFVTAKEQRLTLLSGNLRHMDLLLQIGGPASVLLYAAGATAKNSGYNAAVSPPSTTSTCPVM